MISHRIFVISFKIHGHFLLMTELVLKFQANNMSILYRRTISFVDKFVPPKLQPIWNHSAGPKTVFFWSPLVKWGLVIAGIGDLQRPAEQLSMQQSASLGLTGIIWSRYSLVIVPKNYGLFSVNVFVALTQFIQVYRAYKYDKSQKAAITQV